MLWECAFKDRRNGEDFQSEGLPDSPSFESRIPGEGIQELPPCASAGRRLHGKERFFLAPLLSDDVWQCVPLNGYLGTSCYRRELFSSQMSYLFNVAETDTWVSAVPRSGI